MEGKAKGRRGKEEVKRGTRKEKEKRKWKGKKGKGKGKEKGKEEK